VPLHSATSLLKSCKHGFTFQGWLAVYDVVIAGGFGWMPSLCLAEKPECEGLLCGLDAKQFGFGDGFRHQLCLIEWY
jgi:hypothetical protein